MKPERGEFICESCGAPDAVRIVISGTLELLCPRCTRCIVTWTPAHDHLRQLLGDALYDWLAVWATSDAYADNWQEIYSQMTDTLEWGRFVARQMLEFGLLPGKDDTPCDAVRDVLLTHKPSRKRKQSQR